MKIFIVILRYAEFEHFDLPLNNFRQPMGALKQNVFLIGRTGPGSGSRLMVEIFWVRIEAVSTQTENFTTILCC